MSFNSLRMHWVNRVAGTVRKEHGRLQGSLSKIYNSLVSTTPCSRETLIDVVCVTALLGYFLYFALPSLKGGFNADEMMNLYFYWQPGLTRCLWANVCFWTDFYRPAGALYYLPLYHFFLLNPEPYRIAQVGIVAASIPIIYWLSLLLVNSRSVAFLAAIAVSYHADLANLVFRGSYIYDALCGFFYLAAVAYYIHIRGTGSYLRPLQLVMFLLLYICALNSKEMAVTLPVIALIYEILKWPRLGDWRTFVRHNWRSVVPPLVAAVLTAIYIYGKLHGSNSLITHDVYRPTYSFHSFLASNASFVSELRFDHRPISAAALLLLWAAVFVYAFIRRDHAIQLMAFWVVFVPLPIAFISPIRGGGCLYLLLFGWAIIFAKLASDVILLMSKCSTSLRQGITLGTTMGAAIGVLATHRVRGAAIGAAIAAAICVCAAKLPPRRFRAFGMAALVFSIASVTQWENGRLGRIPGIFKSGQRTLYAIRLFRSLDLHPAFGSSILLKSTFPFKNKWTPLFIASLVWNNHSLDIRLDRKNELSPQQVANVDYVISLTESEAKLLRGPNSRQQ